MNERHQAPRGLVPLACSGQSRMEVCVMWSKEQLDREMTWEEFQAEIDGHLKLWISRRPRPLRSWLYSVEMWARGDH